MGLLTDRINIKLERSNLINEHALNRGPVPLGYTGKTFRSKESKIHNKVFSIVENVLYRKGDVFDSFSQIVCPSLTIIANDHY